MIANLHFVPSDEPVERRREPRLRYSWDAQLYLPDHRAGTLGRMVDLNSRTAAVLVDRARPLHAGQWVELALTYPRVEQDEFQIIHDHRQGWVLRMDDYNDALNRMVVQFDRRLDECPAVDNDYVIH